MAHSDPSEKLPHFNIDTMSGVFPGTRTRRYHVLQVHPVDDNSSSPAGEDGQDEAQTETREQTKAWVKAFWREDPASILICDNAGQVLAQVSAQVLSQTIPEAVSQTTPQMDSIHESPAVGGLVAHTAAEVAVRELADFDQVYAALREQNQALHTCGSCRYWQRLGTQQNHVEQSQLTAGICRFQHRPCNNLGHPQSGNKAPRSSTTRPRIGESIGHSSVDSEALARDLRPQSPFALLCAHWHLREEVNREEVNREEVNREEVNREERDREERVRNRDVLRDNLPTNQKTDEVDFGSDPKRDVNLASSSHSTEPWLWRIGKRMGRRFGLFGNTARPGATALKNSLPKRGPYSLDQLDRSGIGAGTEPCLGCNGRIANLGALIVETDEGDKQTYSVWRCRVCGTTYLNNWIDRWERLDNLETEEQIFRVPPAEAAELLTYIHGIDGGDHPKARGQRTEDRVWFEAFLQGCTALSHQVRHGR